MNSEAVNGMNLEGSVFTLFAEFLTGYFDGQPHTVGAVTNTVFPKAVLRFQENALPLLATDTPIGISAVWLKEGNKQRRRKAVELDGVPTVQTEMTVDCAWMFLVRAAGIDAQKNVEEGAGKLFWLLQNSLACLPLAQKGIHLLRPCPPRPAMKGEGNEVEFKLRVLTCTGQVRYLMLDR